MKLLTHDKLKSVKYTPDFGLYDMILILESISTNFRNSLNNHFEHFMMVVKKIIPASYLSVRTMAKKTKCSDRTIQRSYGSLGCIFKRKKRWLADGRQTSSYTEMFKRPFLILKAFSRLGLFRPDVNFKERLSYIKKKVDHFGGDWVLFCNWVYNVRYQKKKDLEVMNNGLSSPPSDICHPISNSISNLNGTYPSALDCGERANSIIRRAKASVIRDLDFCASKTKIRNKEGLTFFLFKKNMLRELSFCT